MSQYPDGFYLWQFNNQHGVLVEIAVSQAHVPSAVNVREPSELTGNGMTLTLPGTLWVPASEVVEQALTIYTILCGVDENRIEAAQLLDTIKAWKGAE